jgi:Xaa-Pro aminopeptidase
MDHALRRRRLAERLSDLEADALLVTSLPNVRYLTGFSGSNGQLVLTKSEGVFLTDGRYVEQSRHEVPDLRRSPYSGDFSSAFAKACSSLGAKRVAFEAEHLSYRGFEELSETAIELVPTSGEVEQLRLVKDADETEQIEAAQAIADHAFEAFVRELRTGMTEREAALVLDTEMRRGGADGPSFDTILAFGENAAEPHHHPSDRPLERGDVVKMDYGCVMAGYHSDMTRTVAFREPKPEIKEIYEVVLGAQRAGVEAVRSGITAGKVDRVVRDLVKAAGYGSAFTHPLGHGVGLQIHEGPMLRSGSTEVLPEGAVVTVEPGVYVAGVGGVRIEDMVEVTADGARVIPTVTKELMIL